MNVARVLARRSRAIPLALVALAVVSGCGDGDATSAVPVPEDCLQSWNSEGATKGFGRHAYADHQTKQAQLALIEPPRESANIPGTETCAMVFAVPEGDAEYGDVGLVVTRFGWASMQELAREDQVALEEIQREASLNPNVNVFPDGTVEPT